MEELNNYCILGGFDNQDDQYPPSGIGLTGDVNVNISTTDSGPLTMNDAITNQILERLCLVETQVASCLRTQPLLHGLIRKCDALTQKLVALETEMNEFRVSAVTTSSNAFADDDDDGSASAFQETESKTEPVLEVDSCQHKQSDDIHSNAAQGGPLEESDTGTNDLVLQFTTNQIKLHSVRPVPETATAPCIEHESGQMSVTQTQSPTLVNKMTSSSNSRALSPEQTSTGSSTSSHVRFAHRRTGNENLNRPHKNPRHQIKRNKKLSSSKSPRATERYVCDECGVMVIGANQLYRHKREVHRKGKGTHTVPGIWKANSEACS